MAFQALQGVKVIPIGANNRYVSQNWQTSQAFGGWIFKADCKIGFADKPTEITMQIVLETSNNLANLIPATFDISYNDLQCNAGVGGIDQESLYNIDFNGVLLQNFVLFSYDMDIQPTQKTLTVTFKDYSVILDKIYIGLVKRQGVDFIKTASASGVIPVVCPDCEFGAWTGNGQVVRDIDYGSYVGIGGQTYDNFAGTPVFDAISAWDYLYNSPTQSPTFDLNGGYLIVGMEQMYSAVCSTLPEVKYTLQNLISSLNVRGLNFQGAFTGWILTGTPYTQNYIGTLREVLNQWCSDFGLQFFTSGRSFIGLDMTSEIDISGILTIADPTTSLGSQFNGPSQIALGSYKESHTLDNTFKQSAVVADVRPRQINNENKSIKNFVYFQPLHPLDFYSPDFSPLFAEVLGNLDSQVRHLTTGVQFANNFNQTTKRLSSFTNRLFSDIDTCIALTKYDPELRDIFCANRAIQSNIEAGGILTSNVTEFGVGPLSDDLVLDFYANFSALGFIPQLQITGLTSKQAIIDHVIGTTSQNLSLHPSFYEIFVGYHYPKFKEDVISFESTWAESMYKFGVLNIGTQNYPPYVIKNFNQWDTPTGGLYGVSGASLERLVNTFNPAANFYPIYQDAPYYHLMPYPVIGFNPYSYTGASLNNIGFDSNQYYIGELSNEWGTLDWQYKQDLYNVLSPVCQQMFATNPPLQVIQDGITDYQVQQFHIGDFTPKFNDTIDNEVYSYLKTELDNLPAGVTDELGILALGTDSRLHQECAKLYLLVVPNTQTHPNVRVTISPNDYYDSFNPIMARTMYLQEEKARLDLAMTVPINICQYAPDSVICNTLLAASGNEFSGNPRYSCTSLDDPISILYAGWPSGYASGYNARSLSVTIERNPVTDMSSRGTDGEYYYDATAQFSLLTGVTHSIASTKIIYPICNRPNDLYEYIGVMTSDISREIRTPPFTDIYGEPINQTGNNTSLTKIINYPIPKDLVPVLNPYSLRFVDFATVYSGNSSGNVLYSVEDYYNFVSGLDSYQSNFPMKGATFSVIGSPNLFGTFINAVTPLSGLTSFTVAIGDNGVETNLTFSNKPPTLPKQESILNSIGPRMAVQAAIPTQ